MLHIRMAPAEQQDLLAALDVFLSLPLYVAKQDGRINKAAGAAPGTALDFPNTSPGMRGGHQPGINTLSCRCQDMPGAVCIASPSPSATRPSYFGVPAAGRGSKAAPFPYWAACQRAQALPKDVILFLRAIKPFALQAAPCLQLSHAWPCATSGLKKNLVFTWMQIKGSF